jgi:hypothetical protein
MKPPAPPAPGAILPDPTIVIDDDGTRTFTWEDTVAIKAELGKRDRRGKYPVTARFQGEVKSLGDVDLRNLGDRRDLQAHCATLDGVINWLQYLVKVAELIPIPEHEPFDLTSSLIAYGQLMKLEIKPPDVYFEWLAERSLWMVYGPRGVGKSLFLMSLSIALATGGKFLTWSVGTPAGVLYVDGEMTLANIQERACDLAGAGVPEQMYFLSSEMVFTTTGRDLSLRTIEARKAIERVLDGTPEIKVLILDNISCLFGGISENKKEDWEPINAWLISLRHRGVSVILGHHAGKGGQQRGTSAREDSLNGVMALHFPPDYHPEEGCHFQLHFEKTRGMHGPAVQALDVKLESSGLWTCAPIEASQKETAMAMLGYGMSPRDIADELKISKSYVYRLKREMEG